MKPLSTFAKASTALALLLFSCSKDGHFLQPPEVVQGCRISALNVTAQNGLLPPKSTLFFNYDTAGRLVAMTDGAPVISTTFDYYFRYDHFGRLSDYIITTAGSTAVLLWHRYSYPNLKTIVDTTFDYQGLSTGPPPTSAPYSRDVYTLDNEDRIISWNGVSFQYDRNGDLVRSGITYDNKVNLYRTNPAFLLINRDYSLHNALYNYSLIYPYSPIPLDITGYNSFGLPLEFKVPFAPGPYGIKLNDNFDFVFTDLQISYDCDGPAPLSSDQ